MKIDFKQDYIGQTAAHFTTFPQTEQSKKILAAIRSDLLDRARAAGGNPGGGKSSSGFPQTKGSKIDISV